MINGRCKKDLVAYADCAFFVALNVTSNVVWSDGCLL